MYTREVAMAAAPFPHRYEVDLSGTGPAALLRAGRRPTLVGGAPPEFGGSEAWWSPEHLLLSSLALCLLTTFRALAARRGLEVEGYASRATATLDRTEGGLAFTRVGLAVTLDVAAEDAQRAEELLRKAKAGCLVGNALRPEVELTVDVRTVVRS